MAEDVTFLDLAALIKIGSGAQLERLGSALNSSIFDASNIAGALKQKGLIEFTANYPGPNNIIVTEAGKALVAEADSRSAARSKKVISSAIISNYTKTLIYKRLLDTKALLKK